MRAQLYNVFDYVVKFSHMRAQRQFDYAVSAANNVFDYAGAAAALGGAGGARRRGVQLHNCSVAHYCPEACTTCSDYQGYYNPVV